MAKKFIKEYPRYLVRKFKQESGRYYLSDGRVPIDQLWQVIYVGSNGVKTVVKAGTRDEACEWVELHGFTLKREA